MYRHPNYKRSFCVVHLDIVDVATQHVLGTLRRLPGHLITGAKREEVLRKGGGEEARSVRCMCDVCAAHGGRAAVGVDVDAQGSGLREDETHFPLIASLSSMPRVEIIESWLVCGGTPKRRQYSLVSR